jgi:light-regulated signal transduction histidine kinase (bacteriophytochrome)
VEGFANMLAKRYKGKLDEKADEFISYITEGVRDMQMLIKDVLEYSKVGSGKKFKKVDTSLCLAKAISNLKAEIDEKEAVIKHDDVFPTVMGDSVQLTSVFQNLIENAIKFSKETPVINICVREKNQEYVFSVQDNGIGIDAEYIDKVFNVFQRLHSRNEYSGTGIGLAICKKIFECHGGRIWVESEIGKGSTFYFTLPMVQI